MTVTQLAAEICSRAGEGYQNYTDRALAHFKSAVLALLNTSMSPDVDAPGLCAIYEDKSYDVSDGILLFAIYDALNLTDATILSIEVEGKPLERLSAQQYAASKLRPDILINGSTYYLYSSEEEKGGKIVILGYEGEEVIPIVIRAIGWRAELSSTTSDISIESYFSTNMLEKAIMLSTEELKREIAA